MFRFKVREQKSPCAESSGYNLRLMNLLRPFTPVKDACQEGYFVPNGVERISLIIERSLRT